MKKSVLNYALTCISAIKSRKHTEEYQLEDLYDEIQAIAASLKVVKDFNTFDDFVHYMRKVAKEIEEG